MKSLKIEYILNRAVVKANELAHEFLTLEGVLWALLDDEVVLDILEQLGLDIEFMENELEAYLGDKKNFSILKAEQIEELSKKQFIDEEMRKMARENGISYQPEVSVALQRVIQRAAIHVQSSGKSHILGINLLVALFQEKESFALYLLEKQGVTRLGVLELISHGKSYSGEGSARGVEGSGDGDDLTGASEKGDDVFEGGSERRLGKKKKKALSEFCSNLAELVEQKKIDPLIGREQELERIVQILCRRRKNNPILVGDAGVGKTAIAEGLAWSISQKKVPEILENTIIYSLDMASLLAGAKFRGDFEQRLKAVIKELAEEREQGQENILFIDEFHTIMGAGATAGGSLDASNLLKPALSSGKIRCLGSTTFEEYRKFVEKDPAFNRRFQKIEVSEPSLEDTFKILQGLRPYYEDFHGVKYSNKILKAAIDLSNRYISDKKLPDKAIDILDEAGAMVQLLPSSKRKSKISLSDIEEIVSKTARVPMQSVKSDDREKLKGLKEKLSMLIFGQEHAIERITDAILLARSGLGNENRPQGCFLFAGPTGVGKTELSRQLAFALGIGLERFDMSEFMEKHSISKLIGAPPGYVGHEQGGLLTETVNKTPHCVVLMDEIEKAHPDIYNILLQVMDYGKLTDSQGRSTDFRNIILIMTTNAGAKEMESGMIGLAGITAINSTKRDQAIKRFFSPEFRNRLDAIVHFGKLQPADVLKIVDKFIYQLELKLAEKEVELEVQQDAKDWFARKGFDPQMGARPLGRLIDEKLKRPLSKEILFGELEKGGKVVVKVGDADAIDFEIRGKTTV